MRITITGILLVLLAVSLSAQKPAVTARWFRLGNDSVLVDCSYPKSDAPAPAVLILPDRFGVQKAVRQLMASLASKGYRAFAIQLASTPPRKPGGFPPIELHSSDYELVAQIAIDISNDSTCTGKVGLIAFDAGATIGMEVARRLPLFKSCHLFYPSSRETMMRVLPELTIPVMVQVGSFDPELTPANMADIREACMEKGKKMLVTYLQGAKPMFFNLEHENYDKVNTVKAWAELTAFLNGTLSGSLKQSH
jgi:dienelactone hydrolase